MGEVRLTHGGVIAGKWVLVRPLGRGGMGEVWLATHHTLRQEVAIKILDRDAFPVEVADEARSRFDLEARIAAKLARKTRHIVTVIDNGRDEEIDYLVMELLEGESLEDRLGNGPLDPALVVDVVRQASRGLMVAHGEDVIHRDLKPSNLYFTTDENGERVVKLLDFGIAKARRRDDRDGPPSSHATRAGVIIGTAQYMSPEQARGLAIDSRADVWALAAVAYELFTAHPPFESESDLDLLMKICTTDPPSPRAHRPSLPSSVEPVFARAFARAIEDRYQDTRSFADALAAAFEAKVVPSRAPESVVTYVATPPPMPAMATRSRAPLVAAAAIALLLAAVAAVVVLRKPEPAAPRAPASPVASIAPAVEIAPVVPSASASAPASASASVEVPSVKPTTKPKPATPAPKSTDKSEIL